MVDYIERQIHGQISFYMKLGNFLDMVWNFTFIRKYWKYGTKSELWENIDFWCILSVEDVPRYGQEREHYTY